MARHYRKRGQKSILQGIDWSMNPDTSREIVAVVLLVLGLLITLGLFNLAGSFGHFFIRLSTDLWGLIGYLIPFIFLGYGYVLLFPDRFELRPASAIGSALILLFFPALLNTYGGLIGSGIRHLFDDFVGVYASILILFGLTIISFLITFNTSIKSLWERLGPSDDNEVRINEPKASVFTTLRSRAPLAQVPMAPVSPLLMTADKNWKFPPVDLLENVTSKANPGNITKNVEIIQKTLSDFGMEVTMGDVNVGPTVAQYSLKPADGVKLNQITARINDLSLALAQQIRIEAPIPGKSAVGIEVPNKTGAVVTIREVLESDEFKNCKSNLSLALGRDVAGDAYVVDLKKMPHLLIAGATGSGKSVGIHGIIISLLYQNSPSDLRLILVDPKRVELSLYKDIPHLLCPVVSDLDKTVGTLKWAVAEMDRRFRLFQDTARRNIEAYNANPPQGRLPYIVVIIDELADLMAQAGNEVEGAIVRLAQMARAVGIHLVVATQRPSVDVITGLIKANITNRIAFAVASQIDSRTILDTGGAERLLGLGDMLHLGNELGKPKRIQGVLVTDKEVGKVADFLRTESSPQYDDSLLNFRPIQAHGVTGGDGVGEDDLYEQAKETVVMAGKASASLLQRRLRVGYARAARLLDLMEENGIIGPPEGAKPRDVLIDATSLDHERSQVRMPMNQASPVGNGDFHKPFQDYQKQNTPPENYLPSSTHKPLEMPEDDEEEK